MLSSIRCKIWEGKKKPQGVPAGLAHANRVTGPSSKTAPGCKATSMSLVADLRLRVTSSSAVTCLSGGPRLRTPKPSQGRASVAQALAHLPAHLMGFWTGTCLQLATAERSDRTDERRRFNASAPRIQLSSRRTWAPPTAGVGEGSSNSPLQGAPVIKPSLSGTLTWQAATVLFHRIIFSGWRITSW